MTRRINLQYDWDRITSLAYLTLIELNINEFPIPIKKIKCKEVIITSFQKYAKLTGCNLDDITCGHEFDDAFYLSGLRPGLKIILYNKEKYDRRLKHTLWHEVGHVKCEHKSHREQEEIEAHFFASQANAPNILIKALCQRGYEINTNSLMTYFGLSNESAEKKMSYLQNHSFNHENDNDDLIIQLFTPFLDLQYPPITQHFYDFDYEERERERDSWKYIR